MRHIASLLLLLLACVAAEPSFTTVDRFRAPPASLRPAAMHAPIGRGGRGPAVVLAKSPDEPLGQSTYTHYVVFADGALRALPLGSLDANACVHLPSKKKTKKKQKTKTKRKKRQKNKTNKTK